MRKILFMISLCLFLINSHLLHAVTIRGNDLIWSTEDKSEFLYSMLGKGTGKKIWKIYNLKEQTGITLFYDTGIRPVWSWDGKIIAIARKDEIDLYTGPGKKKTWQLATEELIDMDFSLDSKKMVYSDGAKIHIIDLEKGENSFLVHGKKSYYINNDKNILFFDENYKLSVIDKNFKIEQITDKFIEKICPFKKENKFVFQDEDKKRIKLFDLDIAAYQEIVIVKHDDEITDFSLSYDNQFIIYAIKDREIFIVHIPTRLKVKVSEEENIFTPRLSRDNAFCSYEKQDKIFITDISKFIQAFRLDDIFKINVGSLQGVQIGTTIEVYEERRNPFSGQVIGMDANKFKGVLKVISVYDSFCYGRIDEEYKTKNPIEENDIAYWKEKEVMGVISR
ncbi:MAG: WD40 repeat domain-containing protein [Spirochaetes bacterium]|nr:WD40 repeat domain-containing protein [Spirochaetota bacterium]